MDDVTVTFFGAIFGSIVGSFLSYRASVKLFEKQQSAERANIAKAIDISFANQNSEELIKYAELYSNEKQKKADFKFYPMQPLYSKDDIYFSFVKDVCKFDYKLSANIYQYFSDLIKADMDRQFIADNCMKSDPGIQILCDMKLASLKKNIISCANKIPYIRQEILPELQKMYKE